MYYFPLRQKIPGDGFGCGFEDQVGRGNGTGDGYNRNHRPGDGWGNAWQDIGSSTQSGNGHGVPCNYKQ